MGKDAFVGASSTRPRAERVRKTARQRFGYDDLRPGQEEAIRSVVGGRDTVAVLPTGAGKSAIYYVAGAMIEGATVVVSPLVALQKDQEEAIEARDEEGDTVERLNSSLSAGRRGEVLAAMARGELEFLLLAPEQFANPETIEQIAAAHPSLFVVDEAHCISEWGHDFRPDYLRLGAIAEALGRPTILALTATAAPPVREEIAQRLGMVEPKVVVHGFDRPEIRLVVDRFANLDEKRQAFLDWVDGATPPGIVYVATRAHADDLAAILRDRGIAARPYHAGLSAKERDATQNAFMAGETPVVVATVAFGMGIDKQDVRFVAHFDVSDSIDAYYQEIGRAGRDGAPAEARLFFLEGDLGVRRFLAAAGKLDEEDLAKVAETVQAAAGPIDAASLSAETGLAPGKVALARLDDAGAVIVGPGGEATGADRAAIDAAAEAAAAQERHRRYARTRIEMMRGYAETSGCRREYLLAYFGEEYESPCGNCDVCLGGGIAVHDHDARPYPIGATVTHAVWGEGQVMRYEGETVTLLFGTAGYRTLDLNLVQEEALLVPGSAEPPRNRDVSDETTGRAGNGGKKDAS